MTDAAEVKSPRMTPCVIMVEAGKSYSWCTCGRSATQPLCDGAHKGSGLSPVRYTAEKTEWLWFCGCKQTGQPPFCDGSHKALGSGW